MTDTMLEDAYYMVCNDCGGPIFEHVASEDEARRWAQEWADTERESVWVRGPGLDEDGEEIEPEEQDEDEQEQEVSP